MVLFPIAIVWIGFVLYWTIVRNGVDTDEANGGSEPRRWPRRPRASGPRPSAHPTQTATPERPRSRRERAANHSSRADRRSTAI